MHYVEIKFVEQHFSGSIYVMVLFTLRDDFILGIFIEELTLKKALVDFSCVP